MRGSLLLFLLPLLAFSACYTAAVAASPPDLIIHNGKIVTVDHEFQIQEALAVQGERIIAVGRDAEILSLAGPETKKIDLKQQMVLPGLIDSHVHPTGAATYEFDHQVPEMETISDVLNYIKERAKIVPEGDWIVLNQVFITRLKEKRFPTRLEMDEAAPNHPVYFRTGPDAALNSLALEENGIGKDYEVPAGVAGKVERDPETGELTGILRGAAQLARSKSNTRSPNEIEQQARLKQLFHDYNSVGITSISDRGASLRSISLCESLKEQQELTCRVYAYLSVNYNASLEEIEKQIRTAAEHKFHPYNNQIWVKGIKIFLDGGMLTGSAYMQKPWGISQTYGISDPKYQGIRNIDPEKLYEICKLAMKYDLQITAHSVGDGAVQTLVDTYALIHREDFSILGKRPCVTHCNFMTPEAIDTMAELGIVADLQPAWLWLDGNTLTHHFGTERLKWFQPYRTLFDKQVVVGGGSDHMQKIGSLRSVNPYNPFLGMWITLSRQPRWSQQPLHENQKITRQEAIKLYTINNAWLTFEEKQKGSLEPGKLADFIIVNQNLLTCPAEDIKETQVLQTWLGGKLIYEKQ